MREAQSAERRAKSETNGSERDIRAVAEARESKERERLRAELRKRANRLLKGTGIGLEEEDGEIGLGLEAEAARVPAKAVEGFNVDAIVGDPAFRTETRRIGSLEYVVTERVRDRAVVRPDGHGAYPEKEDLRAAMLHGLSVMRNWQAQGVSPEQAALVAHHHHRQPKEWLWRAAEALLAAEPSLGPAEAVRRAGLIVNDLITLHRERMETV